MEIESHAYAHTEKKAQALAQARIEYVKEKLLQQLPKDTEFGTGFMGHTTKKVEWLKSTDIIMLNLAPDVKKLGLPPCLPQPIKDATTRWRCQKNRES